MIVAITGNVSKRSDETFDQQYERILALIERAVHDSGFRISEVVCGRKNGVDRAALLFARLHNLPARHFAIRFSLSQNADALIAFHDGSKTTREVVRQMSREGKLVHMVRSASSAEAPEETAG